MSRHNSFMISCAKAIAAVFAIAGLITYAIKDGGNTNSLGMLMLGVTLFLLGMLVCAALIAVCTAHFNQWKLQQGAVDTQWLFFERNPPGFEQEKNHFLQNQDRNTAA